MFSHEGFAFLTDELAHNASLEIISLSNNSLGNEGARLCGEMLKINSTLQYLWMRNVQISQLSGLVDALASTFESMPSLIGKKQPQ
jgi:Ran GTPase-activating protein (RanGAP) involved in mRNA processing and transport